jgi:hypothetical protein
MSGVGSIFIDIDRRVVVSLLEGGLKIKTLKRRLNGSPASISAPGDGCWACIGSFETDTREDHPW